MTEFVWRRARKKPVEVDFRNPIPNTGVYVDSSGKMHEGWITSWKKRRDDANLLFAEKIETLEGTFYAFPELDWVVRGVKGELYPVKKDIFEETYELIV